MHAHQNHILFLLLNASWPNVNKSLSALMYNLIRQILSSKTNTTYSLNSNHMCQDNTERAVLAVVKHLTTNCQMSEQNLCVNRLHALGLKY